MTTRESLFGRLVVAIATVCVVLLFGATGAHADQTFAVGPLVAQNHEDPDEGSEGDNSENEDSSDEDSDDEDNSDEEDENSDEDNESDEPTDPPTFTDPPTTDATDVTEMPTQDADETSEATASSLGWILLGGGVACAAAAVAVYRRNQGL